ncbi:MAG: hypothetical protein NC929_05105 [Candidatus Omnitrophica bacterium]|nr:hypothetical protein [Candidatus Omnitrophota bacterium]
MAEKIKATEEQIVYANLLDLGMKIGLLLLFISFVIYVVGILPSYLPVKELPNYWGMSVHDYLEQTDIPRGWKWLNMINYGDFLNFIGIAFLAAVTIGCYLRIVPILFRKKDAVYGIIALIEVLVLVLAASGILKVGGH